MLAKKNHEFSYKIWIEDDGKGIMGRVGVDILARIDKEKSISTAAKELGMSYTYVWNYLKKVERVVG